MTNEELAVRARAGAEWARAELVVRNAPFVSSVARRYARRCRSLELGDLESVGQVALLHAADKFDPARGVKFLTYAAWWVRATIDREVSNYDGVIAVPVHLQDAQRSIYNGTFRGSADKRAAAETAQLLRSVWSLDAPVRGAEDLTLADTLAADGARSDDRLAAAGRDRAVRAAVDRIGLDPRERAIVERRLMGEATLDDVASGFGLSRERVRQIEVKLLDRLAAALEEFADS